MITLTGTETNPLQLADREKFACIALHIPFFSATSPFVVDDGLTILGTVGKWVKDHWKEWLSPSQLESLHEADLLILAHAPSDKPDVLDAEHESLMVKAGTFLSGLLFTGIHVRSHPILLKGSFLESRTDIRSYGQGSGYLSTETKPPMYSIADDNRIKEAVAVYDGLNTLMYSPTEFLRFKRGIRSAQEALQQQFVDERTFYFVRAFEALHGSVKGEGKGEFVAKCTQLTGANARYQELFGDLYDTRNNYVHVNEFDQLLKPGEDMSTIDTRLALQSFEAEVLVLETYRRILSDPTLVENFQNDTASRAHWKNAWPSPVTVEAIRAQRRAELEATRVW